jgi:hypothetical protein
MLYRKLLDFLETQGVFSTRNDGETIISTKCSGSSSSIRSSSSSSSIIMDAKYLRAWDASQYEGKGKGEQDALCAIASPPSPNPGWLAANVCLSNSQRSSEIFCDKYGISSRSISLSERKFQYLLHVEETKHTWVGIKTACALLVCTAWVQIVTEPQNSPRQGATLLHTNLHKLHG